MLISVGSIIRESIDLYKNNAKLFLKYILLTIVPSLVIGAFTGGAVVSAILLGENVTSPAILIGGAILMVLIILAAVYLSMWINVAFIRAIDHAYTKTPTPPVKESLLNARPYVLRSVGASVLAGLYAAWPLIAVLTAWAIVGFIAMANGGGNGIFSAINIILGLVGVYAVFHAIYYSIKYVFATYEVILDEKKMRESLEGSKALTQHRWWSVLWRILAPAVVFWILLTIVQLALEGFMKMTDVSAVQFIFIMLSMIAQLLITPLYMAAVLILYRNLKQTPVQTVPIEPTQSMNT